ncbi:MAG TPA: condensation domain-containing protein, partial [Candidatus Deferrimicrobium sp.]|nr:condensation domain-containing protein [Candidatus Deferrimicrobium sp.]
YILDKYDRLQPVGAAGELYIDGAGLARGYLNRPELTSEKFIKSFWKSRNLFSKRFLAAGGIFYRTGDLARWLDDGNIEFLGRMDHQVKIRGFRIETGEIETVLLKHNAIRSAVVLAKEEGYLCAYFTSEKEIPSSLLREYTAIYLPDYMIPSYFIRLEKIPLTSSGKIDRKALPEPGLLIGREYTAPTGKVEEKLAEIWAEVLGISRETIGAENNFFHLGGHSLRATVLMSKIHKYLNIKIPLEEIFKTPTIRGLALYVKSAAEDKFIPIPPAEEKEYYVLSASQDRFYMFQQLEKESTIYNTPEVVLLQGQLDRKKLEEVFRELIARHESFRTSFIIVGGEVVQQIRRDVDFEIEYTEDLKKKRRREEEKKRRIERFIRPFDLSRAPLLRVGLIKEKEDEHILLVDTHHIISDGASQTLFIKEFMNLYRHEKPGPGNDLKTRYKDYAEWQNTPAVRKVLKNQEEYWLNEFTGNIPAANLPADFERPEVMHFEGSMMEFRIETGETGALKRLASDEGVSLFGLVLTILNIFLFKITRQEDICIGTQVAGRRHPDLQGIIGVFLNSLALRNFPGKEKTFKTFLHQVMERTLQAFENQEYRFESLVEKVLGKRDVNRNPLFDVMLVWQNFERQEIQVPGFTLKPYPHEHKSRALTDLSLYGWEMGEKLSFTFEYSTELFEKETVSRFITYFKEIVTMVIANREIKLKDIKISHDLGMAEPGLSRDSDDSFGF